MNLTKLARISALALILFLTSISAFAQPPCGCDYCQADPQRECRSGSVRMTCADFLIVALCPAPPAAAMSSADGSFLAAGSGLTQEPSSCLTLTN